MSSISTAIGPSICQECYEVSEDVAEAFRKEFRGDLQAKRLLEDKGNGKYQLDLWRANEIVLTEAGIKEERIQITDLCTCHNPSYLFSHRAFIFPCLNSSMQITEEVKTNGKHSGM